MADDAQYGSNADALAVTKRKFEDPAVTPPPAPRRPTGFSAPISSGEAAIPPSYNTPLPLDEIQLAKQRAQEIAARLFSNASSGVAAADAKRARVENGSGFSFGEGGFSGSADMGQKFSGFSSAPSLYGHHGASKKIDIPNGRVGVIIGKSGDTIKYLQHQSGAKIQVTRDADADPHSLTRMVELVGTSESISKAEKLINDVLAEAETGGSGTVSRRVAGEVGFEQFVMKVPNNKVGLVIGKGGETIKNMQTRSGARIQVIPLHLPPGDTSTERTVQIDGTTEQIESAKQLVNEVTSENRARTPTVTGGYSQQGYSRPPPTNWAQTMPPPVQQPGYGYMQPGTYPVPSPQYMSQPPYGAYPQPTSGGYPTNWDQSTVPPTQQTPQGGGYDYYGQQQPLPQQQPQAQGGGGSASTDATNFNYNQPPASGYGLQQGQGYSQDGYGGGSYNAPPHSGYGQPQANVLPGYEQQQQGYNSAPAYGDATNPSQDGQQQPSVYGTQTETSHAPAPAPVQLQPSPMGQQGYNNQLPGSNPVTYPPQGSIQPGYAPPGSQTGYGNQPPVQSGYGSGYAPQSQPQKPPAGQPGYVQNSPSTQGSYGQPPQLQPGYQHPQSAPPTHGFSQPDSGLQRTPPSGYVAAAPQAGYGPPPYGAPPASQGYLQQPPPPYNGSYGGSYAQQPVYCADSNAGAPAQPVLKTGATNASPKS